MKTVLMVAAGILTLSMAAASIPAKTALGWNAIQSVRAVVAEKGYSADKTYTVVRQGNDIRVEGTFPVYGAFSKSPHVELTTDAGAYLYVPAISAAVRLVSPMSGDRGEPTYPVKFEKDLLELPRDVLEKELKQPARMDGEETIAGRPCYILTTAENKSSVRKLKQWLDKAYGIPLKTQEIEADKVVFERVTKEVSVNGAIAPSQFTVPEGTTVIKGIISMLAFERFRDLDSDTGYASDVKGLVGGLTKYKPGFDWTVLVTPPAGFGHADTSYKPLTAVEIEMVRENAAQTAANALSNLPPGTRVMRDRNGNLITIQGGGRRGRGPGSDVVITNGSTPPAATSGGDAGAAQQNPGQRGRRGGPNGTGGPGGRGNPTGQVITNPNNAAAEAKEGIFTSEFINPSDGSTFIFIEAKELDPTYMIAQRATLGKGEKVSLPGVGEGTLYETSKPYKLTVLAWKQTSYFVICASGVSREDLLKVTTNLRPAK